MKKNLLGAGLLVLALLILFQEHLRFLNINIWLFVWILVMAFLTLYSLLKRHTIDALVWFMLALIPLNSRYQWLHISTWWLIVVVVLVSIGLNLLFKPKRKWLQRIHVIRKGELSEGLVSDETSVDLELAFGSTTKYINDESFSTGSAEIAFGTADIYFDNVTMTNNSAVFNVEVVFGTVNLYIPKTWSVDVQVERAFSSVDFPKNNEASTHRILVKGDAVFSSLVIIYV